MQPTFGKTGTEKLKVDVMAEFLMWERALPLLLLTLLLTAFFEVAHAEIPELPQSRIARDVEWSYKGWKIGWELRIPTYAYLGYTRITVEERIEIGVANMVTHDDLIIASLASGLAKDAKKLGFGEYDTANYILAFVQSLRYHKDEEITPYKEYWKFPLETLAEGWGDCEDSSILYAALMKAAGYDVVLFDLPEHMAVGVALSKTISGSYVDYNGKRYYYAETTNPGWTIGKAPQEVIGKPVTVIPIPDKPSGTQLQIEKINEYLNYNPERLKQLENENSQLKQENQKLLEQVSQLQKENQKLKSEYQELAEKNQQLANQLEYLQTINEALSKTNEELIEENENLSFQVMQLESEKAQLEWKIDDLEFKIRTLNHTISELKPKAMMMDALIGALPMLLGIGIAVLIGIAVAFYYLGRSAERKEILGI
ncbi:MAG: hypothetical protein DRN59_03700 [Thaumarchaeota archaeon]|nr:MAG: hypothetical protein DRN59_03700 [Nitrososphaerota archaeon]